MVNIDATEVKKFFSSKNSTKALTFPIFNVIEASLFFCGIRLTNGTLNVGLFDFIGCGGLLSSKSKKKLS